VKGFALTLGLTTLVDLVVVALFTHPILQLISRRKYFSEGHRFSGLDPRALGAVYRGRATFREPMSVSATKRATVSKEAQKRQTIAERKAAELEATKPGNKRPATSVKKPSGTTSSTNASTTNTDGKDS
jgi:preprotein translocase subunit SecD